MTNIEKYSGAFITSLQVAEEQLTLLSYQSVEGWDSVGHMNLIAVLEEAFDIMMETDDIIDLSSFERGKEILMKKYNIEF